MNSKYKIFLDSKRNSVTLHSECLPLASSFENIEQLEYNFNGNQSPNLLNVNIEKMCIHECTGDINDVIDSITFRINPKKLNIYFTEGLFDQNFYLRYERISLIDLQNV